MATDSRDIVRFTSEDPCPICGGWDRMGRGEGKRCHGYLGSDRQYAHCSREDHAGRLAVEPKSGTYAHRLAGPCHCGGRHDGAVAESARKGRGRVVAVYDYADEQGEVLFRVRRYANPKGFLQFRPDGRGGWIAGLQGVRRILYNLPAVIDADPDDVVWVVEGEKDVERLQAAGLVATCNPMGAGKWRPEYGEHLCGRRVGIIPDNDDEGRRHAAQVAAALAPMAAEVRVVALPGLPPKGDVSDWLNSGGDGRTLRALFDATTHYENNCQNRQNCQNPTLSDNSGDSGNCFQDMSGWEEPIVSVALPPSPFPVDCLPDPVAEAVAAAAACIGCPVDYPAVAALGVASAAIGRSVAVRLKAGWVESAALYLAAVGDPGASKSPAIGLMTAPLRAIAADLLADHRRRREQAADDVSPPPLDRVVVDDTTVEALAPILRDNPRGVAMVRDELTALFAGHNQYKGGKGSDRQFYLSAWSNSPVTVDRKLNPDGLPIHVPHPFLTFIGGVTPGMLSEMGEAKGRDDGFLDRILFTYPAPARVRWNPGGMPPDVAQSWEQAVRWLWSRRMVEAGIASARPYIVEFSEPAAARYVTWFDALNAEAEQEDFPPALRGPWAKLRAYCARLALVLDRLRDACDIEPPADPRPIQSASVAGAIRLVEYFKSHVRRARAAMRGAEGENADARALLRWIARAGICEFSERDARHNFPSRFPTDGPELAAALRWLEGRHCTRPEASPERPGPGRKHSPVYEVNPALLSSPECPTPTAP